MIINLNKYGIISIFNLIFYNKIAEHDKDKIKK